MIVFFFKCFYAFFVLYVEYKWEKKERNFGIYSLLDDFFNLR